eukprot:2927950-Amphidinium_carterae.2
MDASKKGQSQLLGDCTWVLVSALQFFFSASEFDVACDQGPYCCRRLKAEIGGLLRSEATFQEGI